MDKASLPLLIISLILNIFLTVLIVFTIIYYYNELDNISTIFSFIYIILIVVEWILLIIGSIKNIFVMNWLVLVIVGVMIILQISDIARLVINDELPIYYQLSISYIVVELVFIIMYMAFSIYSSNNTTNEDNNKYISNKKHNDIYTKKEIHRLTEQKFIDARSALNELKQHSPSDYIDQIEEDLDETHLLYNTENEFN
jgi:hypothetical protein